jgi:hypothetical protein
MTASLPAAAGVELPGDRKLLLAYLVFLHVMAIVWGTQAILREDSPSVLVDLILPIVFALAVVQTCVIHSRISGRPILHIVRFIMLLTWPVTAPAYLIWSRRWRGLLWAGLLAVTLLVCSAAGALVAETGAGSVGNPSWHGRPARAVPPGEMPCITDECRAAQRCGTSKNARATIARSGSCRAAYSGWRLFAFAGRLLLLLR